MPSSTFYSSLLHSPTTENSRFGSPLLAHEWLYLCRSLSVDTGLERIRQVQAHYYQNNSIMRPNYTIKHRTRYDIYIRTWSQSMNSTFLIIFCIAIYSVRYYAIKISKKSSFERVTHSLLRKPSVDWHVILVWNFILKAFCKVIIQCFCGLSRTDSKTIYLLN